ncbi:serine O-acetyltransferase [Trichlorobacter ammonificans]|uniref:Serine acetyltransferase n=1 Tax=Trichlorobacter ammonificans TaxID=2916410 RepID=A0ABN8HGP6_9BACT|nr:serine O-acetyltransferase [Trichlorobacter ammonificans]CAH2031992.1 serine acetyltransferase [Trichlorobacter ammonificans]
MSVSSLFKSDTDLLHGSRHRTTPVTREKPDPVWTRLRQDVFVTAKSEPILAGYLHDTVLKHETLEGSISYFLAGKLASPYLTATSIRDIFYEALTADGSIREAIRRDLSAVVERDPAARSLALPFLNFKGFQALQSYRVAHWLWHQERKSLALYLQSRISEAFDVDIHPAARIGKGILIDHGTSVVIGETAVVGDDVSMLHEVTLGGTGKESGDRHPKVGNGVLLGAGAKILGNIKIGDGSKIAAGSVVLNEVPPHSTVAGIPARVVGKPKSAEPGRQMDQYVEFDYCI